MQVNYCRPCTIIGARTDSESLVSTNWRKKVRAKKQKQDCEIEKERKKRLGKKEEKKETEKEGETKSSPEKVKGTQKKTVKECERQSNGA